MQKLDHSRLNSTLITGGAGFIGSAVVRRLVSAGSLVVNLDKLTYAGDLRTVAGVADAGNYSFAEVDICDADKVRAIFEEFRPQHVLHLAAESHVDRSIDDPQVFVQTNVAGTATLLAASLDYWNALTGPEKDGFRFVHVSTDEVYGDLGETGRFCETSPYAPSSPYAASKAASDHLVRAWHRTYGLPANITNCSNNFGPFQHREKLIPTIVRKALRGEVIPIYGSGKNVRDWLFVEDHVDALLLVAQSDIVGETYSIGGSNEWTNIDICRCVCGLLDGLSPRQDGRPYQEQIEFVTDRPGHDRRYAIDSSKIARDLGWRPANGFEEGLRMTLEWYLANPEWWRAPATQADRIGLQTVADE